jgi:hypothetical protein
MITHGQNRQPTEVSRTLVVQPPLLVHPARVDKTSHKERLDRPMRALFYLAERVSAQRRTDHQKPLVAFQH